MGTKVRIASAVVVSLAELDEEKARILTERIEFILLYVSRIKRMTNKEWSTQQAAFIDAVLANATNMPLTKEQYLAIVDGNEKRS